MTSAAKPPRRSSSPRPRRNTSRLAKRRDSSPQSPTRSVSSNHSNGHRLALNCSSHSTGDGTSRMTRTKTNRRASLDLKPAQAHLRLDAGTEADSKKANRPVVSQLLRTTHKKLKAQIGKVQEQIRFIQNIATMKDDKKIETLFDMIDSDGGGSVDAGELARAMRQNDELSFSESIEKAIDMVAKFDTNGDGELDKEEFQAYVKAMVKELELTCSDFCELIIVQLLLVGNEAASDERAVDKENISEEVKKRKSLYAFISKNKEDLDELFGLFKKTAGKVKFVEVARAFANSDIVKNARKRFGTADALEVLLMTNSKDDRMLDFKQFGRLVLSIVTTSRKSFDDVADSLFESVKSGSSCGSEQNDSSTSASSTNGLGDLTSKRLNKLFTLWDADGDGDISKEELSNGLRLFQTATGMQGDTDAIAKALISFDTDGDNQLDPQEFSQAMVQYAKLTGVELNVLIDFMCISTSMEIEDKSKSDFPEFNEDDFEETEFELWG